jgi:uncharacterized membrane protein YkoI
MDSKAIIITALLLVLPAAALAAEDNVWRTQLLSTQVLGQKAQIRPEPFLVAEQLLPKREIRGTKIPKPAVRLGRKQATDKVKQRYRGHKILSINLISSKGPATYRVKTLSSEGVVKYVFVDGNNGDVFE